MGQRGPAGLLDERKRAEICAILASGGSQADAASYVGCSPGTICNTANRDPAFAALMQRARATCTVECLTQIHAAGAKSWRAAAWMLERTRPEEYEKVNLRQASAKQLNGFWRACGDELLAGLPPEQQELLRQRFKQVAKGYAARALAGNDEWRMARDEADWADEGDFESQISNFRDEPEREMQANAEAPGVGAPDIGLPESALRDSEALHAKGFASEIVRGNALDSEILRGDALASEILNPEILNPAVDADRLVAPPASRLWQVAAAAVLLVAAVLWGSLARSNMAPALLLEARTAQHRLQPFAERIVERASSQQSRSFAATKTLNDSPPTLGVSHSRFRLLHTNEPSVVSREAVSKKADR